MEKERQNFDRVRLSQESVQGRCKCTYKCTYLSDPRSVTGFNTALREKQDIEILITLNNPFIVFRLVLYHRASLATKPNMQRTENDNP
jgi:hypothetical protein